MIKISKECEINLEKLIATRMLINANSGGGKSWAIRRLLEQSHGQVQQIVIDLEGEFSTLREKFGYLLVGKEGEIPCNIRTAELLAKRLLELNVSTIIDLSELKQPERITFVKRFLDSLINSPKELWHPCWVIVDEAHHFAPEHTKSESSSSVIDLMTRGRKRGFCGILATQRISKLSKDAIAEANNCMIGRAVQDIDQKRASDILGFITKDDMRSLRDLKAGEFYSFGPAFKHNGVEKIMVGDVQTTHPDRTRGIDIIKPIETPENIKRILKEVIDLPKEAEEELRTITDMKKKIQELKTRLTIAERSQTKILSHATGNELEKAKEKGFKEAENQFYLEKGRYKKDIKIFKQFIQEFVTKSNKLLQIEVPETEIKLIVPSTLKSNQVKLKSPMEYKRSVDTILDTPLRAGAMKMLNWLAGVYPKELSKQRLATLSGFSVKGGTFNTYISELKRNGWIVGQNEFAITEEGLNNSQKEEIPTGEELLSLWKSKFREGAGKILQFVYESYPNSLSKEEIAELTGFEVSGGTFNTYLSELRRNGLIEINGNDVKISEEFFE